MRQGLRLIRQFAPAAIRATFPNAAAHVIGTEHQRRSGPPWVANLRDLMVQDGYPLVRRLHKARTAIEPRNVAQASLALFTTPSAAHT